MTKKQLENIIQLTQESLKRYWQLDCHYVLSLCDKNVSWIGSIQSQFMQGYDAVQADFFHSMQEIKPCHLLNQEFHVTLNHGNSCVITGRYLVTTDESVGYYLQVQQRCTFAWEMIDKEPKIKHIHISNPMGELQVSGDESFVNTLGNMSKRYIQNKLENKTIVIDDDNGSTRFIRLSEIIYATAEGKFTIIHTMTQQIRAKISISDFSEMLSKNFITVHRSFVVNVDYIVELKRYSLIMIDKSDIPIPVKKYDAVKQKIEQLYDFSNQNTSHPNLLSNLIID